MKLLIVLLLTVFVTGPGLRAQDDAPAAVAANSGPAFSTNHAEMQKIEDRWSDAVTKRDQYGLELVLAPQLVDISATGDVTNRNQQIVSLFKKDSPILSLEQKVIAVRYLAGGAVAIVNGTYVLHTKETRLKKDEKGIFTHVFTQARSGWLCVSSQRTLVVEQVLNKPRARGKRQAPKDGDLPLKVPLIYDGDKKPQD